MQPAHQSCCLRWPRCPGAKALQPASRLSSSCPSLSLQPPSPCFLGDVAANAAAGACGSWRLCALGVVLHAWARTELAGCGWGASVALLCSTASTPWVAAGLRPSSRGNPACWLVDAGRDPPPLVAVCPGTRRQRMRMRLPRRHHLPPDLPRAPRHDCCRPTPQHNSAPATAPRPRSMMLATQLQLGRAARPAPPGLASRRVCVRSRAAPSAPGKLRGARGRWPHPGGLPHLRACPQAPTISLRSPSRRFQRPCRRCSRRP